MPKAETPDSPPQSPAAPLRCAECGHAVHGPRQCAECQCLWGRQQPARTPAPAAPLEATPARIDLEVEALLRRRMAMYDWTERETAAINDFILTVRSGVAEDLAYLAEWWPERDVTDDDVRFVDEEVGCRSGMWDHVPAERIIAAAWKRLAEGVKPSPAPLAAARTHPEDPTRGQ